MHLASMTRLRALGLCLLALPLLAGCGMQAVDNQVRASGEVGVPDEQVTQVLEQTYICPHIISEGGQVFDTQNVRKGEVEKNEVFGPFAPCGTVVPAGQGLCPTCRQPYHTPGTAPEAYCSNLYIPGDDGVVVQCNQDLGPYQEGKNYGTCPKCHKPVNNPRVTIEALPQYTCPVCKKPIDPIAIHRLNKEDKPCPWHKQHHGSPSRYEPGQCPNCGAYISTSPTDVVTTLAVPEEILCGACGQPVDPSLNACTNPSCPLGGVVRNVDVIEGPCWRCGGTHICPECGGSGGGTSDTYGEGSAPSDCWFCYTVDPVTGAAESTGRCPECDNSGFTTYVGDLPPGFEAYQKGGDGKALPSAQRGWQFPHSDAADAGGDAPAEPAGN